MATLHGRQQGSIELALDLHFDEFFRSLNIDRIFKIKKKIVEL